MKKLTYLMLISGFLFMATLANAQFRKIPGVVTDSFKIKYPAASGVEWSDKVTSFQATFMLDSEKYTAKYTSKGEWQSSQKTINKEGLPAAVKDGLAKSKYADWDVRTVITRYLPGNKTQYGIRVSNTGLPKNLLFSSDGQLLNDNTTL